MSAVSCINEMKKRSRTSEISKLSKTNGIRNICKSSTRGKISYTNE